VASVLAVYTHFRLHGRKCVSYSRRVVFSHHHIMAASVVDVIIPSETVKFTTLKFSTQTSGPCGYSQTRIYTHLSSSGSQTAATACLIYSVVRRQSDPTPAKAMSLYTFCRAFTDCSRTKGPGAAYFSGLMDRAAPIPIVYVHVHVCNIIYATMGSGRAVQRYPSRGIDIQHPLPHLAHPLYDTLPLFAARFRHVVLSR